MKKGGLIGFVVAALLGVATFVFAQGTIIGAIPIPSGGIPSPGTIYLHYATPTPTPSPTPSPSPTPIICNPIITSPIANQIITGTFIFNWSGCTMQSGWFARIYIGNQSFQSAVNATSLAIDTTLIPNGTYIPGIIVWNNTGLVKEGVGSGPSFSVSNGTNTPTPTLTPTPSPTVSPSPSTSPTPTPSPSATPTSTPSPTATPSSSPSPSPTASPTSTPTVTPPTPTPSATPTPVVGSEPVLSGAPYVMPSSLSNNSININAFSTNPGDWQHVFVYGSGNGDQYQWTGYPATWRLVCSSLSNGGNVFIAVHQNVASEPISNSFNTNGTAGVIYTLIGGAATNTAGYDGSSCIAGASQTASQTLSAPSTSTSGANDLTITLGSTYGVGPLVFSGPSSFTNWVLPGNTNTSGFFYDGVPTSVTYSNTAGTANPYLPGVWQLSYAPLGTNPSPIPSPSPTPTPAPTPTPLPTYTPTLQPAPSPLPIIGLGTNFTRANDFINSLGVNSNIIAGFDPPQAVISAMGFTGQRFAREEATHNEGPNASGPGTYQECEVHNFSQTAANPNGILFDSITVNDVGSSGNTSDQNIADAQAAYEQLAFCGALSPQGIEGPNEPNNQPFTYEGNLCSSSGSFLPCAQFMQALYAMHNASNPNASCTGANTDTNSFAGTAIGCTGAGTGTLPSLSTYKVVHLSEPGAEPDNVGLQFITGFSDFPNLHNYIQGNGSAGTLADGAAWNAASRTAGNWDTAVGEYCGNTWGKGYPATPLANCTMPMVTTETGWQSNEGGGNISPLQQGAIESDMFGDQWLNGQEQTFIYLLYDNVNNGGYGEFKTYNAAETATQNAKPIATYLHNLTSIIADTSSNFTPVLPSGFSVTGEGTNAHHLLLQNSNGNYYLLEWGENFVSETPINITVNFGSAVYEAVYDITQGTNPITTFTTPNTSWSGAVTDHMLVVEF